jgi:RNA polymerase sigma-70 factor (ECF subfamily)
MTVMDSPSPEATAQQGRELELALVARLRDGDAGAFDVVHAELNSRLFNFLARLTRRREVAEDLLEETWLRFIDRAPKLRDDTVLAAFLFTIARNLFVSYCRSRLLEDAHAVTLMGLWPAGTPGPSPYESTAANETERRLESAIARLPALYREALLLVVVDGTPTADAARICGVAPDAMRQRVSRARSMIMKDLERSESAALATLKEITT